MKRYRVSEIPEEEKKFVDAYLEWRWHHRLSQRDIAKLVGFRGHTFVNAIEQGEARPSKKFTYKVQRLMNAMPKLMYDRIKDILRSKHEGKKEHVT